MKYTIELTPEQDAGVTAAREAAKSAQTNKEYLQARISEVADSYVRQWSPDTVEGLANRLALAQDEAAQAKAQAAAEAEKAQAALAQLEAAKVVDTPVETL